MTYAPRLLSLVLGCLLLPGMVSASQTNPKIGVVGIAKQTLTAKSQQAAARVLSTGDDIIFEDTLTTDAQGQTQLIFIDKSTLTIGANSSVVVDKFIYDPASSSGKMAVSSTKGVLRFVGGALSKKEAVTIKTPAATIGIRGGIALVTIAEGTGATNATFIYGDQMTVRNAAGESSTTQPGTAISIPSSSTPPSAPVKVDANTLASTSQSLQSPADSTTTSTEVAAAEETLNVTETTQETESTSSTEGEAQTTTTEGSETGGSAGTNVMNEGGPASVEQRFDASGNLTGMTAMVSNASQTSSLEVVVQEQEAGTVVVQNPIYKGIARDSIISANGDIRTYSGKVIAEKPQNGILYQTERPWEIFDPFTGAPGTPSTTENIIAGYFTTPAGPGTYSFANITMNNGDQIQALSHTSLHGNMYYYNFDMAAAGSGDIRRLSTVLGNTTSFTPSTGINAYKFLPEMNFGVFSDYTGISPFAYATLNSSILPQGIRDQIDLNNPGLLVDWRNDAVLSSLILWNNSVEVEDLDPPYDLNGGNPYTEKRTGMRVMIGDVNRTGTNMISGKTHQYVGTVAQTDTEDLYFGDSNVTYNVKAARENVFGNNTQVDGFVVEADMGGYSQTVQPATQISTPAAVLAAPRTSTATTANPGGHLRGFAGGHVVQDANGAAIVSTMTSGTNPDFVKIWRNPDTNTFGGEVKLLENGTGSGNRWVMGRFGDQPNEPTLSADKAYINDRYYAAEQGSLTYGTGMGTVDPSRQNGAIVSGSFASSNTPSTQANLHCTNCEYVGWGAWASNAENINGSARTDTVAMVPYVAGEMTHDMDQKLMSGAIQNVTATYNGNMLGSVNRAGVVYHDTGTFNATINLGSRTAENFNGNLAGYQMSSVGAASIAGTGAAAFQNMGIMVTNSGTGLSSGSGVVNGALFGPNAQNIGGNFMFNGMETNGSVSGAGVYLGAQTGATPNIP